MNDNEIQEELKKQNIEQEDITTISKKAYLDYSMSVIVSRAIPDVRDGLKPVHRRIIYSMYDLGVTPKSQYKKSARVVGDCIGKYHPHGDVSVYDAMIAMAQDFKTREPLCDGQGNWGNVDGDSAAAMRYTEVRLTEYGYSLLHNIDKKSINFNPNYDDSTVEPEVLPALLPNILINGTEGIAVGMSTEMCPHNVSEIINATIATLKNPNITISELRKYIKGPDLPTGGILMKDSMDEIYTSGMGRFYIKSKYHIEDDGRKIVITEIPFQVKKTNIILEIAELVKEKRIFGIVDAQDESNKDGLRIVLTIKKGENIQIIMNTLFKKTSLQKSFSIKNLVIKNKEPVIMNVKEILDYFIAFRKDIVTKDINYDVDKLNAKVHVLKGITIALNNLDLTLSIIRASKNSQESKEGLIKSLNVDEIQAQAIIDTKLQKLSSLETQNIFEELQTIEIEINRLLTIISTDDNLRDFLINQLKDLNKKFKSERRTLITDENPFISNEELITDEDVAIIITKDGFVRKTPLDNFKSQHRGGKGKSIISLREDDYVKNVLFCRNNEHLTVFTKNNKAFSLPVYTITENLKGRLITNLIDDNSGVFDIIHTTDSKEMLFVSEKGQIVKLSGKNFINIRKNGIKAIRLNENDKLVKVLPINEVNTHLMVTTKNGITMTTLTKNFRMSGRGSIGVKGMSLSKDDIIVDATVVKLDDKVLLISEKGFGKQNLVSDFRITNRGSKGVKSFKISDKTGNVVGIVKSEENKDLVVTTKKGIIIRTPLEKISTNNGRVTVGVKVINVADNDIVISFDIYEKMEDYED